MASKAFKGFKMVYQSTYDSTSAANKAGWMWFTRKDSSDTGGNIYMEDKLYGTTYATPIDCGTF